MTHFENQLVALAAEIQRQELEAQLRRQRIGRLISELKLCPLCVPQCFDASFDFVPTPIVCRKHARELLERIGVTVARDGAVSRAELMPWVRECAA